MRYLFKALKEIRRASRYQPLSIFGTIVTIFLAMLLPGLFWVAANNLSAVEQKLKINMTVDVFLQEGVSQADIEKLGSRFLELENITEVIFYSKQDALYKMREAFGQDIIQDLDQNPLPASFSLVVDEAALDPGAADTLIAELSAMDNVEEVVFARDILNQFSEITASVKRFGIIIAILVIFSGIFISANTVRVAITDRKEVVEIMQVVGASRDYILTPFVLLGGLLGFTGTTLSGFLLWYITIYISRNLVELKFLSLPELTAFVLSGLLLGMLGSILATKRYLKI
jgi:cell division transport system permease protein